MASLTLVIMAAGIGSRYGGLKQIDPVGPSGEIVIDYSIYDALRAGFESVVFIIRKDIEAIFRDKIGKTVESRVETNYIFQELDRVPKGSRVPAERKKPWGTAHAILCCADEVRTPFAVINADDFYGRTAYDALAAHLRRSGDSGNAVDYAMVGYLLGKTLSEHGYVTRAVCQADGEGYLIDIHERLKIQRFPDAIKYAENEKDWMRLAEEDFVSMNIWGFRPSLFEELKERFALFLKANVENPLKSEFLIPEVVGDLVRTKRARVKILPTQETWFGVTYPEDRPRVQAAIQRLVAQGTYPERLWG